SPTATVWDFAATYGEVPPTALPKRRLHRFQPYTGRPLGEHLHPWRDRPSVASRTAAVSGLGATCGDTPPTGCRSAAFIAPSRTQHARYRHFSTHGDEFRLRLHPRRFGISPPPMAKSRRRRCQSAAFIAFSLTRSRSSEKISTPG